MVSRQLAAPNTLSLSALGIHRCMCKMIPHARNPKWLGTKPFDKDINPWPGKSSPRHLERWGRNLKNFNHDAEWYLSVVSRPCIRTRPPASRCHFGHFPPFLLFWAPLGLCAVPHPGSHLLRLPICCSHVFLLQNFRSIFQSCLLVSISTQMINSLRASAWRLIDNQWMETPCSSCVSASLVARSPPGCARKLALCSVGSAGCGWIRAGGTSPHPWRSQFLASL